MNPAVALFFGWGASLLGFAFAAMVRPILIDDPRCVPLSCPSRRPRRADLLSLPSSFLFPLSLQQVTLYRSMQGKSDLHKRRSEQQMKVRRRRRPSEPSLLQRRR